MKIAIVQKIRPFSHRPGASCLIPGTCALLEAFPALIRFAGFEHRIDIKGPIREFTLLQDLEKNCVFIFGRSQEKFYRFRLQASDGGFELFSEKTKERRHFPSPCAFYLPPVWERLSLGAHKALDWDLVLRRFDLKEILPVLFGLGQKIPAISSEPLVGTGTLLSEERLEDFCRAAFSHILVPQLRDEQHLGLISDEPVEGNPFFLLQQAKGLIRSLFFKQNERRLTLLPSLCFPAGRLIHLQAPGIGAIDLEWANRRLRRVILRAASSGEILLQCPQETPFFRIRSLDAQTGKKHHSLEPFLLKEGKTYLLDQFQK
jgi:hypothetical protein